MTSFRHFRVFPTVCVTAALFSAALLLSSCDDPKKAAKPSAEKVKMKDPSMVDSTFKAARAKVVEGKFSEAADSLKELAADPKTINQPQVDWIILYQGLALALDGKDKEAREAFGKVEDLGVGAKSPANAEQAAFLVSLGHRLRGDQPGTVEDIRDTDRSNYEGFAYLLLAAKDWSMEKYEEAVPLFEQFNNVLPEKMVFWADGPEELAQLKQFATNCANDYKEYKPVAEALKNATTTEQQAAAVEAGKAARGRMKLNTKLSQTIDAALADLGPKVASIMAERSKASEEERTYDERVFPEATKKRAELMEKFQFTEARQAILEPQFRTDKARDDQRVMAKRSSWLANFKSQLIEDFNAKGYAKSIPRKSGPPIGGGVVKADELAVHMKFQGGDTPVPWGDLAPEALFEIGQSFITPDMTPQILSFRKWHLGVYGSYIGKKAESLKLMKEAAEVRTILQPEVPAFEAPITTW